MYLSIGSQKHALTMMFECYTIFCYCKAIYLVYWPVECHFESVQVYFMQT